MIKKVDRNVMRKRRHIRVRKKIFGTLLRPRLNIFRSSKNIYAQLIDDSQGVTLASASTLDSNITTGATVETAHVVGKLLAERALEKGLNEVIFDRGGYLYHGQVKALAEGAREGGLKF